MSLQEKILKRKLKKKEKQKLKVIEGRKTAKLEEDEESVELENMDENEPTVCWELIFEYKFGN